MSLKENILQSFNEFWEKILGLAPQIILGFGVMVLFIILGKVLYAIFNKRIKKRWNDSIVSSFSAEVIKWIFYLLGIIAFLHIVGFGGIASSMLAGAGVSAIIFGFAFKDIAENFLAGIILALNRPFRIKDIVEIENYKGTVEALDLRTTHIRMFNGRDVFVPNSMIVKNVLTNYTRDGLIRLEFEVGLDTLSNVQKAQVLILNYMKTEPKVLDTPEPLVLTEKLNVSSVDLKVMFWINVFQQDEEADERSHSETAHSKVMRDVKDLLLANGFNMPASILEHKMYSEDDALLIHLKKES